MEGLTTNQLVALIVALMIAMQLFALFYDKKSRQKMLRENELLLDKRMQENKQLFTDGQQHLTTQWYGLEATEQDNRTRKLMKEEWEEKKIYFEEDKREARDYRQQTLVVMEKTNQLLAEISKKLDKS